MPFPHLSIFIFSPPAGLQVYVLATQNYFGSIRCSAFYSSDLNACCFLCLEHPRSLCTSLPCFDWLDHAPASGLSSAITSFRKSCDFQGTVCQAANCVSDHPLVACLLISHTGNSVRQASCFPCSEWCAPAPTTGTSTLYKQ